MGLSSGVTLSPLGQFTFRVTCCVTLQTHTLKTKLVAQTTAAHLCSLVNSACAVMKCIHASHLDDSRPPPNLTTAARCQTSHLTLLLQQLTEIATFVP